MAKIIIISAPSGAGKSTIIHRILEKHTDLEFAISATSRSPRSGEMDGKDYYFISVPEFKDRISNNQFLEWEEVYSGSFYGTLKSEITRISDKGKIILFDLDAIGALNVKKMYPTALIIFIVPPSLEELKNRLKNRATDSVEAIEKRIGKAEMELKKAPEFDYILLNDNLEEAVEELEEVIKCYTDNNLIPGSFRYY